MLGDDPLYPHPTSLFAYAHLGSEVKMRPGSGTSIIVDNYCASGPGGTKIEARVVSGRDEVHLRRGGGGGAGEGEEEGFGSDAETEVEVEVSRDGVRVGGGGVEGYRRGLPGDERVGYAMSEGERRAMREKEGKGKKGKKQFSGVPWWIEMLEYVPLIGRTVSHFPGEYSATLMGYIWDGRTDFGWVGLYFRSLQQMEQGDFVWRRN
jgi:hypothetical protein